jgi:hypothetical protein
MNGIQEKKMSGGVPVVSHTIGTGKRCPKCGIIKNKEDFNIDSSTVDKRRSWCRECQKKYWKQYYDDNKQKLNDNKVIKYYSDIEKTKEYHREYSKKWREAHQDHHTKEQLSFYARERRRKNYEWLWTIFSPKCSICGYNESTAALQLHHLDSFAKEGRRDQVSIWAGSYSLKKFQYKVLSTKLIVLCANCHIRVHAKELSV